MDDTVLILGGRSEIGMELARRLAPGATVVLAARNADRLDDERAVLREARELAAESHAKAAEALAGAEGETEDLRRVADYIFTRNE